MGSPTHLNASVSLSWWKFGCVGLASIDFDSIRWWTGNGVCWVLADGVVLGDDATCDVDTLDVDVGVIELWLTPSEFDVAGVSGDVCASDERDFFDFEFGVDLVDGFPVLDVSLAFDCSSSLSLPPLSSFSVSAASNDLRCIPIFNFKTKRQKKENQYYFQLNVLSVLFVNEHLWNELL